MKKSFIKDKYLRFEIKKCNTKYFILKSIFKNASLFSLLRKNAYFKLKQLSNNFSTVSTINRCLFSFNKKRFSKFTFFSRLVFLKLIQRGKISNFQKASW